MSDNTKQLMSEEFHNFCNNNGIIHRKSAPCQPSANGQAESIVQVLKSAITRARTIREDIGIAGQDTCFRTETRLIQLLENIRHAADEGETSFKIRSNKPSVQRHVEKKQNSSAERLQIDIYDNLKTAIPCW